MRFCFGVPALFVACLLGVAGCGGSGVGQGSPPPSQPGNRSFGVHPEQQASRLHLSARDCHALGQLLEEQLGGGIRAASEPSPPLSRCRLLGRGAHVSIFLDASYAARQRYENRMVEQVQFGTPDPARLPHPVPRVGDPSAGNHDANWVPAFSTLFALRGNRWLTLAYSVSGESEARLRNQAAVLARRAFRLSAH